MLANEPTKMTRTIAGVREIYSQEQIQKRIAEMGAQISLDFEKQGIYHPVVIGVMKGAMIFMGDLVRNIICRDAVQIEFVRLSSYGSATESSGQVNAPYLELPNIYGRHVLIVEDIVDSGRTAKFFLDYLHDQYKPASVKLAAFLDKPSRRVIPVPVDYVGFTIEDLFVIGYGLDYAEKYRELPFLGELTDAQAE
jgi:hypoxanthine phosphoribosyltransferase